MIDQKLGSRTGASIGVEVSPANGAASKDLVSEFVALWQQGVEVDAREFLSRYPEWEVDKSVVLDLAYEEYCCRKEAGANPDPEEFCERYPSFKASLRRIIQAHCFLEESPSRVSEPAQRRTLAPGDTVLGFTLVRELGRGSFAQVFLAHEVAVGNRQVAVKIAFRGAAEAETLGRLRHPNIVPIYSVREDPQSGLTAVCMPYAGSATLCDVLDRAFSESRLPRSARLILHAIEDRPANEVTAEEELPDRLLRRGTYVDGVIHLGALLADALSFTHSRGILHRDLKPSNILLTPTGKPMLLDFNLSFDERVTEERLGGTLPYMSPEHLQATDPEVGFDPDLVTERSDLFSFGVILYELLTGAHPFGRIPQNRSPAEVRAHLLCRQKAGPNPLRRSNPHVDRSVAAAIEKCLAFDPNDRAHSAVELAVCLRKSLSRWQRGRRWVARHVRLITVTAALVLAAAGAVGYALAVREPSHVRDRRAGLAAYQQRQYLDAEVHFLRAAKSDPENAWVWFALARAQQERAIPLWVQRHQDGTLLLEQASENYERAAAKNPDGRIQLCLGFCYGLRSHHKDAIAAYQRAIEAGFGSAEVYNNLAFSYEHTSDPKAKECLDRAIAMKPNLAKAKECLDRAIAMKPNLAAAYHNRAWFHFKSSLSSSQVVQSIIADTQKAMGLWVAFPQRVYYVESMIADIQKAMELSPASPETSELYADAAHFFAEAAKRDNRWEQESRRCAQLAISNGQKLDQVRRRIAPLQLESLGLVQQSHSPLKILRVIDPLPGLPAEALLAD
jgi:serine/threonine protein kinase